jgi:Protein of unknown function (DUF3592)
MLLPGAACAIGVYYGIASYREGIDSDRTDGIVVELEVHDGEFFLPIVEYEVGEKRFRCKGNSASKPASYKVGETVIILYKKDHPERGFIDSFFQRWLGPVVFSFGGIFFFICIIAGLVQRSRSLRSEKKNGHIAGLVTELL